MSDGQLSKLSLILISYINMIFNVHPLGSVETPLSTDQEAPVRFPALPWSFSLRDNSFTVCSEYVSVFFVCVISCVAFGVGPYSRDHRSFYLCGDSDCHISA